MLESKDLKKIVIISYATYPSISPRHIRTNELAKELASRGHTVSLYVLTGSYDYRKYEEETNIKVKPLGNTYFFKFHPETGTKLNIFSRVILKTIGKYLEFPFVELAFNAYKALKKESNIDLLITIAAPYPLHWGAALFRTRYHEKLKNTVWVADCGDPYMGNPFKKTPFYFKYAEKWFCKKADFISIPVKEAIDAYYPEFSKKIKIIPQGFNFEQSKIAEEYIENTIPTFIYAGIFYEKLRDPSIFLDYLTTLDQDFKFILYTRSTVFLEKYKEKLKNKLLIFDYIPREQLILEMSKVDFLINFENPSEKQSPSKLIDYALSGRPILSINTNGIVDFDLINQFMHSNYEKSLIINNIDRYDIKNVANDFLTLNPK